MGKNRGLIVALSFGKGAYEEAARAKNEEGLDIRLKNIGDIEGIITRLKQTLDY